MSIRRKLPNSNHTQVISSSRLPMLFSLLNQQSAIYFMYLSVVLAAVSFKHTDSFLDIIFIAISIAVMFLIVRYFMRRLRWLLFFYLARQKPRTPNKGGGWFGFYRPNPN